MQRILTKNLKAFTLIELLLVIGIIAILAGIIILAINPTLQLRKAEDSRRLSMARNIKSAVLQYQIDHGFIPTGITSVPTDICAYGSTSTGCTNLDVLVDEDYIISLERDILETNTDHIGYTVSQGVGGFTEVTASYIGMSGGSTSSSGGGGGGSTAPIHIVPGAQSIANNATLTFSSGNSNLISMSDTDSTTHEVTLTITNGTLTLSTTTGLTFSVGDGISDTTMTFTGTTANINTALSGLRYTATIAYTGSATFTIVTDDDITGATGNTDSDTVAVTVSAAPSGSALAALTTATNDSRTGGTGNDSVAGQLGDPADGSGIHQWHVADSIVGGQGYDTLNSTAYAGVSGGFWYNYTNLVNLTTYANISSVETFNITLYGSVFTMPGPRFAAINFTITDDYFNRGTRLDGDVLTVNLLKLTSNHVLGFNVDGSAITDPRHRLSVNASNITSTANATNYMTSISGGAGADTLIGVNGGDVNGGGGDAISGGGGADTISGLAGVDTITGGAGYDTMSGGTGNDVFSYTATSDSGIGSGNRDVITDFTAAADDINIAAFAGTALFRSGGNGAADFTGSVFQVAFQQSGGNTIVYIDTDGNNVANFEIQLTGTISLTSSDFVL